MRIITALTLAIATTICGWSGNRGPDSWQGLSGNDLFQAVASDCRPIRIVRQYSGNEGKWAIVEQTDTRNDAESIFLNRFGNERLSFGSKNDHIPPEAMLVTVVDPLWWLSGTIWNTDSAHDLYNLWPAAQHVAKIKQAYPPGFVDEANYSNGTWSTGIGRLGNDQHLLWQPPVGCMGETARILMYILTVGHADLEGWTLTWTRGYVDNAGYPIFTDEAVRMLMEWHRLEPPTERERRRNDLIAPVQGNRNPFVDTPALAEYLWGIHRGEPFDKDATDNPAENPDENRTPLRGRYRLSDTRINLLSPYIPTGVVWQVDGTPVQNTYLIPAELGKGMHELRFSSKDIRGKIQIRITD